MVAQFDESFEEVKVENTVSSMMSTVISSSSSCFNSSTVTTIEETVATSTGLTSHEVFRRKSHAQAAHELLTCMTALDFFPPTLFHLLEPHLTSNQIRILTNSYFLLFVFSRPLFRAQLLRLSNPSLLLRPLVHQVRLNCFYI